MSKDVTKSELAAFLNSQAPFYRGGIPKRIADAKALLPKCIFVSDRELSSDEEQLIRDAVEKGMKLSWEDIRVVQSSSPLPEGRFYLFLGDKARTADLPRKSVVSCEVSEVLENKEAKKKFWEDLKLVLRGLG